MLKSLLLTIGLVSLGLSIYYYNYTESEDLYQLWTSWKAQYGASYDSVEEDNFRFGVFVANYIRVKEHNALGESYYLVINKFSNLTSVEFQNAYTSKNRPKMPGAYDSYCPSASPECPVVPIQTAPSWNWTAKGAVTPVKDQGMCGSCWAFSATGTLEGLYYLNHSILLSFSEQQILDCDKGCYGCDGCYAPKGMQYAADHGIETELDYPYKGVVGSCNYLKEKTHTVNTGYRCLPQRSPEQLRSAVISQPVSVSVEARDAIWQNYGGGVVKGNCGNELDHDVLLVGFDTIDNEDSWIVKNSWGSDWGVNGYIFLSTNGTKDHGEGVCGILRCCNIAINEAK